MIGTVIAGFRVGRLLGEGTFGRVYEAVRVDPPGERRALKVLKTDLCKNQQAVGRFVKEARAAQSAEVPGAIHVVDHGFLADGTAYLIMDLATGGTLEEHFEREGRKLPPLAAVRLCGQIAATLAAVHARGIAHRDLKPENVMLVEDAAFPGGWRTKIVDFGLARLDPVRFQSMAQLAKTARDTPIGTPIYMSPEQWSDPTTAAGPSDVYALGAMLHELVSGRPPFVAPTWIGLMGQHIQAPAPRLDAQALGIPAALADLVESMLRKPQAERPPAAEVAAKLEAIEKALTPRPADRATLRDSLGDFIGATVAGRYRVVGEVGSGQMGRVFEAVTDLGRRVAIKVLRYELSQDPDHVERFFREARATSAIDDRGVVEIFDTGRLADGHAWLVMELLRGESLGQRLERLCGAGPTGRRPGRGGLSILATARVGGQIAAAMAAAHARGVVHRDLKPDNVMLVPDRDVVGGERVKVLDFGIAKLVESHFGQVAHKLTAADGSSFLGSPVYMAPEQGRDAAAVTPAADVYSLGVMLYHMAAGAPPHEATNPFTLVHKHMFEEPAPLGARAPMAPAALVKLVGRMLAKEPAARPSMAEAAEALRAIAEEIAADAGRATLPVGGGGPSHRWMWALAGGGMLVGLLALLGVGWVIYVYGRPPVVAVPAAIPPGPSSPGPHPRVPAEVRDGGALPARAAAPADAGTKLPEPPPVEIVN